MSYILTLTKKASSIVTIGITDHDYLSAMNSWPNLS